MSSAPKRKAGDGAHHHAKKPKKGKGDTWHTPYELANIAKRVEQGRAIEVGDAGIWVTCQRGLERKAMVETVDLCEKLGLELFGIEPPVREHEKAPSPSEDIEDSIQAELDAMKKPRENMSKATFAPIKVGVECVFFMRTRDPVDPVRLTTAILENAAACTDIKRRKTKYVNRLSPVISIGKASINSITELARQALAPWFDLKAQEGIDTEDATGGSPEGEEKELGPAYSYAIRPTLRNHVVLSSEEVINHVAAMVGPRHKVNLGNPDKIILIEIFKSFCGFSVIDGADWVRLRKYNVNEVHNMAIGKKPSTKNVEIQAQTDPEPEKK